MIRCLCHPFAAISKRTWKRLGVVVSAMLVAGGSGCAGQQHTRWRELNALVARHGRMRAAPLARPGRPVDDPAVARRWGGYDALAGGGPALRGPHDAILADVVFADADEPEAAVTGAPRRAGPLPGFLETLKRDLRTAPAELWDDTKTVFGAGHNLLILGLTYGGALALQEAGPDDTVERSLQDKDIFSDDFNDAFGALGNPATHFGIAGLWYLLGQQRQDDKTYEVGKTLFSALIINGLATTAGKLAAWDRAPNGELFAFPSGHTSSAFTFASVMHEAYGPWVGAPLYALGALVAIERLDDDEHYFSDVVMGGVMGLVIGHSVAGAHDFELFGGLVVPYADPVSGVTGIAWHKAF